MATVKDMAGKTFGRLTVVESHGMDRHGRMHWRCKCSCGNMSTHNGVHLRGGRVKSCGCLTSDLTAERNTTHGMSSTPEYRVWCSMLGRCEDSGCQGFKNYGGRGIKVCARWHTFEKFYADMGKRPSPELSIERLDVNGDYTLDNCVWATKTQQARNRRSNIVVTLDGRAACLAEWAELTGIKIHILMHRIHAGWSPRETLTTPIKGDRKQHGCR